jgi:hypothetical protein
VISVYNVNNRGDCEQQGGKLLKLLSKLRPRIRPLVCDPNPAFILKRLRLILTTCYSGIRSYEPSIDDNFFDKYVLYSRISRSDGKEKLFLKYD